MWQIPINVFDKPSAEGKSRSVCTMPRRESDGCEGTNILACQHIRGMDNQNYTATLINGIFSTVDIFARVAKVKLCVPPTQRLTSASERPICLAKSFCVMPRSLSIWSILSAIWKDQSTRCLTSCGVDATHSLKRSVVLLIGQILFCLYLISWFLQ